MLLTVFYDGRCPLCVAEMDQLKKLDTRSHLGFEDIHAVGFSERYPEIDREHANRVLHGLTLDGQLLLGLDVTVRAWSLVGRKKWLRLLRLPLISWFADKAYLLFAQNRYWFSYWLTGKEFCSSPNQCGIQKASK